MNTHKKCWGQVGLSFRVKSIFSLSFDFFFPTSRLIITKGKVYDFSSNWAHWTATELSTCLVCVLLNQECIIVIINFTHSHKLQRELHPSFFSLKCRTVVVLFFFFSCHWKLKSDIGTGAVQQRIASQFLYNHFIFFICNFTSLQLKSYTRCCRCRWWWQKVMKSGHFAVIITTVIKDCP